MLENDETAAPFAAQSAPNGEKIAEPIKRGMLAWSERISHLWEIAEHLCPAEPTALEQAEHRDE